MHKRVSAKCNSHTGKCHYYEVCEFESRSVAEMTEHLKSEFDLHLEYLTMKSVDIESDLKRNEEQVSEYRSTLMQRPLLTPCAP